MKNIFCFGMILLFLSSCGFGVNELPVDDQVDIFDQGVLLNTELRQSIETASLNCDFSPCLVATDAVVKYFFEIQNIDEIDAKMLSYHQVCPFGAMLISSNVSKGAFDESSGNWSLNRLAKGASATLNIECQLADSMSGDVIAGLVQDMNQDDIKSIVSDQATVVGPCHAARSTQLGASKKAMRKKTNVNILDHPGKFDPLSFYPATSESTQAVEDGICLTFSEGVTSLTKVIAEGQEDEFPHEFNVNLGDGRQMVVDLHDKPKDFHLEYDDKAPTCFKVKLSTMDNLASKSFFNCINNGRLFGERE